MNNVNAAVITRVHPNSIVDLTVFGPGETYFEENVKPYGYPENPVRGVWAWPPRV